jgi:hypothetical protein
LPPVPRLKIDNSDAGRAEEKDAKLSRKEVKANLTGTSWPDFGTAERRHAASTSARQFHVSIMMTATDAVAIVVRLRCVKPSVLPTEINAWCWKRILKDTNEF